MRSSVLARAAVRTAAFSVLLACDGALEPESSVLTRLEVQPSAASLYILEPENSVRLTVLPLDQHGRRLSAVGVIFESSDPAVAQVSPSGEVTAMGLGSASVTTSITIAGVTQTAATDVFVIHRPDPAEFPDYTRLSGRYEFEAEVDSQDSWFAPLSVQLFRHRITALLHFTGSTTSRNLGVFTDLQIVSPDGKPLLTQPSAGTIYLAELDPRYVVMLLVTTSGLPMRIEMFVGGFAELQNGENGVPEFAGMLWMTDYYIAGSFTGVRRP